MKKVIGNIILLVFTICFCFFVIEMFLRLFAPQIIELNIKYDWRAEDDTLPYVPKTDYEGRMFLKDQFDVAFSTNSAGFRGDEDVILSPGDGAFRILFIGDSFTFGWGVSDEETYAYRLSESLKKLYPDKNIEMLNAAVYGYDIVQYREVLKRYLQYSPDVIFLGFCLENDFNITPLKSDTGDVEDSIRVEKNDIAYHVREFINHLHLVAMVRDRLYITFPKIRNLMLSMGINNKRDIFLKKYTPALEKSLNKTEKILIEMNSAAKERGAEFIVVLIPLKEQIYCREEINASAEYDVDRPNAALKEILERNNIRFADTLPGLLKKSVITGDRLYFDIDPHWTKHGHAEAAEILHKAYIDEREPYDKNAK
ncbi:MAG: SGNH/GDSL hydrolase family protein [Candidatus Tantalella remota]|nr:SGNH/GDSL hydrolase family protein [Candidatus Tantalella remota]